MSNLAAWLLMVTIGTTVLVMFLEEVKEDEESRDLADHVDPY